MPDLDLRAQLVPLELLQTLLELHHAGGKMDTPHAVSALSNEQRDEQRATMKALLVGRQFAPPVHDRWQAQR